EDATGSRRRSGGTGANAASTGGGSSPNDSNTIIASPTTTRYTPTSNASAVVSLMSPSTGTSKSHQLPSSTAPPNRRGAMAVKDEINTPAPSTVQGWPRDRLRTSAMPPVTYRSATAAPATIPPAKPPPGWLCPANSRYREP